MNFYDDSEKTYEAVANFEKVIHDKLLCHLPNQLRNRYFNGEKTVIDWYDLYFDHLLSLIDPCIIDNHFRTWSTFPILRTLKRIGSVMTPLLFASGDFIYKFSKLENGDPFLEVIEIMPDDSDVISEEVEK